MRRRSHEHVRDDVTRVMKRTRAEKNPGEASEYEGRRDLPHRVSPGVRDEASDRGDATAQILGCDGRDEIEPVQRAPDDEQGAEEIYAGFQRNNLIEKQSPQRTPRKGGGILFFEKEFPSSVLPLGPLW